MRALVGGILRRELATAGLMGLLGLARNGLAAPLPADLATTTPAVSPVGAPLTAATPGAAPGAAPAASAVPTPGAAAAPSTASEPDSDPGLLQADAPPSGALFVPGLPMGLGYTQREHGGSFVRLTLGMGLGHVEGGRLGPEPGFHPIDDVSHTAPVLGAAFLFGGGAHDIALAGELMYERMLTHLQDESEVGFSLYGLGITGTAYSDEDWFVTAHLRWLMMMLWRCDMQCWWDRGDATMGPGVGLTVGREWFDDDDDDAIGLAVQANYASLRGSPELDYYSGLVLLTLTSF